MITALEAQKKTLDDNVKAACKARDDALRELAELRKNNKYLQDESTYMQTNIRELEMELLRRAQLNRNYEGLQEEVANMKTAYRELDAELTRSVEETYCLKEKLNVATHANTQMENKLKNYEGIDAALAQCVAENQQLKDQLHEIGRAHV